MASLADEKAKNFEIEYEGARNQSRLALTESKREADLEINQLLGRAKDAARKKIDLAQRELADEETSQPGGLLGGLSFVTRLREKRQEVT